MSPSPQQKTPESTLDSSYKLLRFIRLLTKKEGSKEISLSNLFDQIIDLTSKGYLLYGFKPGRWVAGKREFTLRSDAFASDLGFLETLGYIQIEKNGEIQLQNSGIEAADSLKLEPKLETLASHYDLKSLRR